MLKKAMAVLCSAALLLTALAVVPASAEMKITPDTEAVDIDFESETYRTNCVCDYATFTEEDGHGTVAKFITATATKKWGSNSAIYARGFGFADSDGNVFQPESGAKYRILYEVKVVNPGTDGIYITAGYDSTGVKGWQQENSFAAEAVPYVEPTDGWVKGEFHLTVDPVKFESHPYLYFLVKTMKYAQDTPPAVEVYLDNVRIERILSYDAAEIDFSEHYYDEAPDKKIDGRGNVRAGNYFVRAEKDGASGDYILKSTSGVGPTIVHDGINSSYPRAFRIGVNDEAYFWLTQGQKYRVTLDLSTKVTSDFHIAQMYQPGANGINNKRDNVPDSETFIVTSDLRDGQWHTVSWTFTADSTTGAVIAFYRDASTGESADLFVDNVKIERELGDVTLYPNNGEVGATETRTVYALDTYETLALPTLAGADFAGWYLDAELTEPVDADATVDPAKELYAKWSGCQTTDFDGRTNWGINPAYMEIDATGGKGGSKAVKVKSYNNPDWPTHLTFQNPDGTAFVTIPGHEYLVEFSVATDWASLSANMLENRQIALRRSTVEMETDSTAFYKAYNAASGAYDADASWNSFGWKPESGFEDFSWQIKADSAAGIYLMLRNLTAPSYVDNLTVTDLTAQRTVSYGETQVSGYVGEAIPTLDAAGDTCITSFTGDTAAPTMFLDRVDGRSYTPKSSLVAVTAVTAGDDSLTYRVNWDGLRLTEDETGATILATVDRKAGKIDRYYPVTAIGLLAKQGSAEDFGDPFAGEADLAGYTQLTLTYTNYAAETGLLSTTATLSGVADPAAVYTVLPYITYLTEEGEKTFTGTVREGLASSIDAAKAAAVGRAVKIADPGDLPEIPADTALYADLDDNDAIEVADLTALRKGILDASAPDGGELTGDGETNILDLVRLNGLLDLEPVTLSKAS